MSKKYFYKILIIALFLIPFGIFAATGTIDPDDDGYKYAVIDVDSSQINFDCANCSVSVTDSSITGYGWSESYGWINLNPTNGGVNNDGDGVLSGYAWGENTGWINFDPTNGGVSINGSGQFTGYAWAENVGWITFDCGDPDSCVYTDWRVTSTTSGGGGPNLQQCNDGVDNDNDGYIDYPNDVACQSPTDTNEVYTACADPDASNFDSENQDQININDDNLCTYEPIPGCTDPTAENYNEFAEIEDGSCVFSGCTNPAANNYDPIASINDGSCIVDVVDNPPPDLEAGCLDPLATNYNPSADYDTGLICTYPPMPIFGCTDSKAENYNRSATDDNGSCRYPPIVTGTSVGTSPSPGGGSFLPKRQSGNFDVIDIFPVIGMLAYILGTSNLFLNFLVSPLRLLHVIPSLLGIRRKRRPWGVVYDSITKQPLDPVYVELNYLNGQPSATSITDLDGRYGFLVSAGSYKISAKKSNYEFPSKKLFGKTKDPLYDNLYFGEEIIKKEEDELIIKNIPMDPIGFNWNEFEKNKNKKLMRFYSKRDLFIARTANIAFFFGLLISVFALYLKPSLFNLIILGVYLFIIVLGFFGIKPHRPGFVTEKKTGYPLSFGVVRVFSSNLNREVGHAVIGKTGKYHLLVPNGYYYIKIEKKSGEDKYDPVFESDIFRVKDGHINKEFKI